MHGSDFWAEGSEAYGALRPLPRALLWMSLVLLGYLGGCLFIKCPENFRRRSVQIALLPWEPTPKLSL